MPVDLKKRLQIQSFPMDCSIRAITAIDEKTMWYGGSKGQFGNWQQIIK